MEVEVRAAVGPDDGCAGQGPRALDGAGATVPVSREDTEAPVLGQQQWEAVQQRRARGQSISAIARELSRDVEVRDLAVYEQLFDRMEVAA